MAVNVTELQAALEVIKDTESENLTWAMIHLARAIRHKAAGAAFSYDALNAISCLAAWHKQTPPMLRNLTLDALNQAGAPFGLTFISVPQADTGDTPDFFYWLDPSGQKQAGFSSNDNVKVYAWGMKIIIARAMEVL